MQKINKKLLIIAAAAVVIVAAIIILIATLTKTNKAVIPFNPSYPVGEKLDVIVDELEKSGFENITTKEDNSGWHNSREVLSVFIDNTNSYKKGDAKEKDANVSVVYSSEKRIYVTDKLNGWREKDFDKIQNLFNNLGFTNIRVEDITTYEYDKKNKVARLSLNNRKYSDEECYLPLSAPIVLYRYTLKIALGFTASEFVGQDYALVLNHLNTIGFTDVETQEITTGWGKPNSIIDLSVNNRVTYGSRELFDPSAKIIIKYCSAERSDLTGTLDGFENKNCDDVIASLKEGGFTNIAAIKTATSEKGKNGLIAKIKLNGEQFFGGECYLQNSAPIVLEYYALTIPIGDSASSIKGDQYNIVVSKLKDLGFTNIELRRADNLINGWITPEGSIQSISVNYISDFKENDVFYYDARIVIVVNTFKGRGCEDITISAG